jgi:hypothetical protein
MEVDSMTRINCVPVSELTDKHLVAEYRELPRLAKHAEQKFIKKPGFKPPESYRLGRGHMDFFVDKGEWLQKRHHELVREMHNRGFTVNFPLYPINKHPLIWRGNWEPDSAAVAINRKRIAERLSVKNE